MGDSNRSSAGSPSEPKTTPARIIIVDDEAPNVKALGEALRAQGFDTAGFTSGAAALEALRTAKFELLLADLKMPGMDGIALLRAASEIDPELVGIIMTGQGAIDTAVEAMKAGALDYILKPFKLGPVVAVVTRALGVRKLRLENEALQKSVRHHAAELEAANQELDAFSFSVSHDLRTPVGNMRSFAQLLERYAAPQLDEKSRRHIGSIIEVADRTIQLIEDLLAFAKMAHKNLEQEDVDLARLLHEVIDELRPSFQDRRIEWKLLPLPVVQGDAAMLRQVFFNYVSNAIKYSRRRDPAIIEIGTGPEAEDELVVHVRDNGAGFDPQYAPRLFGVFRRLHHAHEFEGTGVGLAIVRRIIHRHGGRTWAEGMVDRGATFYFSLRRADRSR